MSIFPLLVITTFRFGEIYLILISLHGYLFHFCFRAPFLCVESISEAGPHSPRKGCPPASACLYHCHWNEKSQVWAPWSKCLWKRPEELALLCAFRHISTDHRTWSVILLEWLWGQGRVSLDYIWAYRLHTKLKLLPFPFRLMSTKDLAQ